MVVFPNQIKDALKRVPVLDSAIRLPGKANKGKIKKGEYKVR